MISASMLYDYVSCPHRVALDSFGNQALRDNPNEFVEMLWEEGIAHEETIVSSLPIDANIKLVDPSDRENETLAAMRRRAPLIYGGRLTSGDLVGEPDLLQLRGNGYIPGDIKSGSGMEDTDAGGKYKKHYAFQLAHYVLILEQLGLGEGSREAFIVDGSGSYVPYMLMEPQGVRNTQTWWDSYLEALADVRAILAETLPTLGALSATCKLCHWHSHCKERLVSRGDLTLIAELGRTRRDAMHHIIPDIHSFAGCDPNSFIQGNKTPFKGVGPDTLLKFHERALLLTTPGAQPYLKQAVNLPIARNEIYFDIEADPMRDVVYLHGFVERLHGRPDTAKFIPFFADGVDASHEEAVFSQAWDYLISKIHDSTIYYFSKYERTAYFKLADKYPAICSAADVDDLFKSPAMIDLYFDVVKKATEWPTYDQSIKTLAQYLGFKWRDTNPSGAASIEWYHRWIETGDVAIKQRILDYNEDDCLATGVVVDGIRGF